MLNDFPVGEILISTNRIQWRISNFLELQQEPDTTLLSPISFFNGEICMLELSPNGHSHLFTEGWLGLQCEMVSLEKASAVRCSILDHWGRERFHTEMEKIESDTYSQEKWIHLTELVSRKEEFLPHGQLHIVCTILPEEYNSMKEFESDAEFDVTNSGEKKNSSQETNAVSGLDELSQSLKDLYLRSRDCDVIIRVQDTEFHAHRLILKARSPAFNAILSHNTLENNSGLVTIKDCDPKIFNDFLIAIYSGKVENLTSDNMCELYLLADKYDVPILKSMCLNFIKSSLSVKKICDIIWLAETHKEIELLIQAMVFFIKKFDEIQSTTRWLLFMEENAALANLLIRQTVMFYKTKLPRCIK